MKTVANGKVTAPLLAIMVLTIVFLHSQIVSAWYANLGGALLLKVETQANLWSRFPDLSLPAQIESEEAKAAGEWLRQSLKWDPYNVHTHRMLGQRFLVMGEYEHAINALQAAVTNDSDHRLASLYLGYSYLASGQRDQAIQAWSGAGDVPAFLVGLGYRAYEQGQSERALTLFELVERLDSSERPKKANMYLALCKHYRERHEVAKAIDWCARLVRVRRTVWTLVHLGAAYRDSGQLERAEAVFEEAIATDPSIGVPHHWLGTVFARRGDHEQAVSEYLTAIQLQHGDVWCHYALAEAYLALGDREQAAREYRVVATSSGAPAALVQKAQDKLASLLDEERDP